MQDIIALTPSDNTGKSDQPGCTMHVMVSKIVSFQRVGRLLTDKDYPATRVRLDGCTITVAESVAEIELLIAGEPDRGAPNPDETELLPAEIHMVREG